MAQLLFPNIAGATLQGFQQGQQMRANRLVGAAMQNPDDAQGYLAQAGAIDPRLALGAQGAMQQQQAQQQAQQTTTLKQIGGAARYYKSALQSGNPASVQAAKSQIAPLIMRLTGKQLPDADTPETQAALDNVIAQTAYLFPDDNKLQTITPGSVLTRGGTPVYSNPAQPKITPQGYQAVLGPDGMYHAEPIPIQGAPNGMGMGQAASGTTPGFQGAATSPNGQDVTFNFPPGTPPEVIAAAKASAVANGDLAPGQQVGAPPAQAQPQQPQTLAQVVAASKSGEGSDVIAQRAQQVAELKARGVTITPDQEQQYLATGKLADFQGNSQVSALGDVSLQGPDYLQSIPDAERGVVKGLLNGTVQLPTGTALKNGFWQSALASVKHADPTWNQAAYKQYADTRKFFTVGQGGQLINSINTAAQHLDKLREDIDALNNGNVRPLAYLENQASAAMGGQAPTNFVADLTPVASELAAVYKGKGVPSDEEIRHFRDALTPNMSRGQQLNVIRGWIDLLAGKLDATRNQYQQSMTKLSDPLDVINPRAQEALQRITILANSVSDTGNHPMPTMSTTPINAPGAQTGGPAPGTIEQGYRFKGGDPSNQANWEPVQ